MTTAILPPGYRIRGAFVLASIDPRFDPEARRSVQHEPEIGPQDDADDSAVALGFRLPVYVAGLIFATLALLCQAMAGELTTSSDGSAFAAVALAVLWAASFSGMLDYAIRGARR